MFVNLISALTNQRTTHSDDSISERIYAKGKEFSSFLQSDSDEVRLVYLKM